MVDLKEIKQKLLQHLSLITERISSAEMPASVTANTITSAQIKDQKFVEQLANQLPKQGCYIYWFEIDSPSLLLSQFKERHSDYTYRCARDNQTQNSKYVYVGSCTKTRLGNRFKQHCGWGNDQTYSLQLRKWLTDNKLTFTFSYVEIKQSFVVQYIEDQMHSELKPLFGKSGSNNKIQN